LIFDEPYGKIYIKFYYGKCAIDGFQEAEKRKKRSFPGQKKPRITRFPARGQSPAGAGRILSQADANSRMAAEKKCFSGQTAF
jgi:hypothetical protein